MNNTIVIRYLASIWVDVEVPINETVDDVIDALKRDNSNVYTYMNGDSYIEYLYETEEIQENKNGATVKVLKNDEVIWTNYNK